MEPLLVVLQVLGLVVSLAVLVYVLRRPATQAGVSEAAAQALRSSVAEVRQDLAAQRGELQQSLSSSQQQLGARLSETSAVQATELARDRESRSTAERASRERLDRALAELTEQFAASSRAALVAQAELKTSIEQRFEVLRLENEAKLEKVRETVDEKLQNTLKTSLEANGDRIQRLSESNVEKHGELQKTLREELDKLRVGNEAKLEKMRETVDEKLQGTLEKRLGESFALVSERLELVQKGLGEMQNLASDVGGLKRVLTNVKSRGSWGEVQLGRQLEDLLTPEQYEQNAKVNPNTNDLVEFAVRLPGRDEEGSVVYLPIDSKFPQEDYERLLQAQESGEKSDVEVSVRALERAIMHQARLISDKYISPPNTTDFAIMYLPTEGLFAEVVRRPGLASRLQNEHRVLVTGPTTLMSLLNSLQMGFRTLAIERRSSEVWQVLSAAKAEFQKYGKVWEKLEKQLSTAQNTVREAGTRTRAVERKLRAVESLEAPETADDLLELLDSEMSALPEIDAETGVGVGVDAQQATETQTEAVAD